MSEVLKLIPVYTVDAFTGKAFQGNPASVCILDSELSTETMQTIAAEMNHSETAFVRPLADEGCPGSHYSLRWFTPQVEVPLCGHATLATAKVIFHELRSPEVCLHFESKSGQLSARLEEDRVALDFPAADFQPRSVPLEVLAALGLRDIKAAYDARNGRNLLLHLHSEAEVRRLTPDFPRLRQTGGGNSFLGVIVTASGSDGYDFVSRYFAPWVGVDEDPVTGAAHCALTPYWSELTGKAELHAYQASQRGGELTVRLRDGRVALVGDAVIVMAGVLRLVG